MACGYSVVAQFFGRQWGRFVTDIRCVQAGPLRGPSASLRLDSLLVNRRRGGSVLGYDRRRQGPWIIGAVARWLHRGLRVVPLTEVADLGPPIRMNAPIAK